MPQEIIEIADKATQSDWEVARLRIDARKWVAEQAKKTHRPALIGPTLNDEYWFNASKSMVEKATSSRIDAAKTVQTMIGWLWGVYTAGAVIGISFAEKAFPLPAALLVAAPVLILPIGYWLAVWAQIPVKTQFDRRIPDDIRDKYYKAVASRATRLNIALLVCLVAAISVAVALIAGSLSKENKPVTPTNGFLLHKHTTADITSILIQGVFANSQEVTLEITKDPDAISESSSVITYHASETGGLNLNLPTADGAKNYLVTARWENRDKSMESLSRTIDLGKASKDH